LLVFDDKWSPQHRDTGALSPHDRRTHTHTHSHTHTHTHTHTHHTQTKFKCE